MGSNPSIDLGSVPYPSTSDPTADPSEHRTQTGSEPTAHLKPLSNRCAASVTAPQPLLIRPTPPPNQARVSGRTAPARLDSLTQAQSRDSGRLRERLTRQLQVVGAVGDSDDMSGPATAWWLQVHAVYSHSAGGAQRHHGGAGGARGRLPVPARPMGACCRVLLRSARSRRGPAPPVTAFLTSS